MTGLLVGTLDGAAAIIHFLIATGGRNPIMVFQYIASGVFGRETAFSGGIVLALWGVLFHYLIAFIWTAFFFLIYPSIKKLVTNKFIAGMEYGFFVWLIMNFIVLPLSKAQMPLFDVGRVSVAILILILCVGLPISLIMAKYHPANESDTNSLL